MNLKKRSFTLLGILMLGGSLFCPPKPKPAGTGDGRRAAGSELDEYAAARGPESVAALQALRVGALKDTAFKPFFEEQRRFLSNLAKKPSREVWMKITSEGSVEFVAMLEAEGGEGFITVAGKEHLLAFARQNFASMYDEVVLRHPAPVAAAEEPLALGLAGLEAEIPNFLNTLLFLREHNREPLSGPLAAAEIENWTSMCKMMGCTADDATLIALLRAGAAADVRFR